MTSSESEGQPPPRKRSRTSANSEDAGAKKARGRPRVDTQDATAADRRRTQIRLAQRAYRQRKETTISSLKQQNNQLQSIIEQMNKTFLRFSDSAMKSGLLQLNPTLAQEFKHVSETFVSLAKTASESNQDGEEEPSEATFDPATELHNAAASSRVSGEGTQTQNHHSLDPIHSDIGWGYSATLAPPPRRYSNSPREDSLSNNLFSPLSDSPYDRAKQSSLVLTKRQFTVGEILDQSRSMQPSATQQLPFGLIDIMSRDPTPFAPSPPNPQIFSVGVSTPEISPPLTRLSTPLPISSLSNKTLPATWTYSHDETTFARRLTRAALETGFHLLSSANLRPAALNYVFKLSLPYMTLNQLRERFKMLLGRGTHEDLDCWETPFIHLGGAGTHYPRKDAQGNILHIPNTWTVRQIGPISAKMIRAENATDPSQSHDLNIDLTGFEGEWFDAYDVEGYLEEKGCHIDPKASFAEVLIEAEEDTTPNTESESPGLSHGSSSIDSHSTHSTPTNNANGTMDNVFRHSETPFGLDMSFNSLSDNTNFTNDVAKLAAMDPSTLFDQPLGLDLAPGFDVNLPQNTNAMLSGFNFGHGEMDIANLGLDLMGGVGQLPVVKQKKMKSALVDVSKLIDEIIKHGVCLGRAPGFRRKDVDMAYRASLITTL